MVIITFRFSIVTSENNFPFDDRIKIGLDIYSHCEIYILLLAASISSDHVYTVNICSLSTNGAQSSCGKKVINKRATFGEITRW